MIVIISACGLRDSYFGARERFKRIHTGGDAGG
jgi:hypothetical protein